jgi:hypothetical protein
MAASRFCGHQPALYDFNPRWRLDSQKKDFSCRGICARVRCVSSK